MANCLIAYNNKADVATLSGGLWLSSLPLSNLKTPLQGVPARSTNTNLSSTKFLVELAPETTSRLVALVNHNLSLSAKVRMRASGSDPNMVADLLFDSGWFSAWPSVYPTTALEWEQSNFWDGAYSESERQGYTWNVARFAEYGLLAKYWLIEIDDIANAAGYVQVGRLFVGEAWQTTINMQFGNSIAWEDSSTVDVSMSGAEFSDTRPLYRVARFTVGGLDEGEAYGAVFDMQRRVGVTREVFFVYDPDDTMHSLRRQYRGRFRQLSAIENPTLDVYQTAFEIKELL